MKRNVRGMSLIELMLALVLGTLVVAAAIGIFVSNRSVLTTSQDIGWMQQNLLVAMELLVRDMRQAGGNPCSRNIPLANILVHPVSRWWTNLLSTESADGGWRAPWDNAIRGLAVTEFASGSGVGARVAGSDAIELLSADSHVTTVVSHDGRQFVLNTGAHGFSSGQLLLVCNWHQASLFQATVSGTHVQHPGSGLNCSGYLGLPGGCEAAPFEYASPALMAQWNPVRWYLGHNGRGGTSLYRITLDSNGQGVTRQEMVEAISSLEFRYLLAGVSDYVALSGVGGRWDQVIAVRVGIEVRASESKVEDGRLLARTAVQTVSLRNRHP